MFSPLASHSRLQKRQPRAKHAQREPHAACKQHHTESHERDRQHQSQHVQQPLRPLADAQPADGQRLKIALITGAEGGFAVEEAEMAANAGVKTVGLGPRILRCETAPLAVLSAVMTLTGNLE